jgi:hypothetical protein
MLAKDSMFANFGQVVSEYAERDMTYRLPADHLLSLIYYNVYRAFHLNSKSASFRTSISAAQR